MGALNFLILALNEQLVRLEANLTSIGIDGERQSQQGEKEAVDAVAEALVQSVGAGEKGEHQVEQDKIRQIEQSTFPGGHHGEKGGAQDNTGVDDQTVSAQLIIEGDPHTPEIEKDHIEMVYAKIPADHLGHLPSQLPGIEQHKNRRSQQGEVEQDIGQPPEMEKGTAGAGGHQHQYYTFIEDDQAQQHAMKPMALLVDTEKNSVLIVQAVGQSQIRPQQVGAGNVMIRLQSAHLWQEHVVTKMVEALYRNPGIPSTADSKTERLSANRVDVIWRAQPVVAPRLVDATVLLGVE